MRTCFTILSILFIFGVPLQFVAQDINYSPKEFIDSDGTIYWNKNLPMYIRVSPYPEGHGTLLKSKNPAHSNPVYLDTEGVNYIRTRYAVDKDSKKVVDPLQEVLMPVFADGTSPSSTILFMEANKWKYKGIQYFGSDLQINLSSIDALSGLEMLKYSLNGSEFQDFSEDLRFYNEGSQSLSYYGVDRVGNKETTNTKEFVIDLSPPIVTHNINGIADQNVIASSSKIYFTATDELSGIDKVYCRFDDEDFKIYDGNSVKFSRLEDGNHTLEYYAVDKVGNQTGNFSYEFYFDKTAPLTASDILGDRFVVNDKIYFSGRTKMKLTAIDNKIGVKDIMYSIDGEKFQVYDQPFYLPSIPGEHSIRYYSSDRLSNRPSGSEIYKHNISLVYLDLTGPDITHRLTGPSFESGGVQYISPKTELNLVGKDRESGVQYLTYSIDGDAAEQVYSGPITINSTGLHNLELFGYDNVNNRNLSRTSVFVDASPPTIYENFSSGTIASKDGLSVYPSYVTVFLAATDDIVGNDKIYYRINDGKERLYTKPLNQLRKGVTYKFSIRAIDMVGNESSREIQFMTADN